MQISGKKQKEKAQAKLATSSGATSATTPASSTSCGATKPPTHHSTDDTRNRLLYVDAEPMVNKLIPGMVVLRGIIPVDVQTRIVQDAFRFGRQTNDEEEGVVGGVAETLSFSGSDRDALRDDHRPGATAVPRNAELPVLPKAPAEQRGLGGATTSSSASATAMDSGFYSIDPKTGALKLNMGIRGRLIMGVEHLDPFYPGLCNEWVKLAHQADPAIPNTMVPTVCLMNYYLHDGSLKWHVDSEHPDHVRNKTGPPIISITVGDSCEFGFKHSYDDEHHTSVLLHSGDVLLFGGPARMIVHSVLRIIPTPRPPGLVMPSKGRLNITLRDVRNGTVDSALFPRYVVNYSGSKEQAKGEQEGERKKKL
jgi:hypothetical protein